MRGIKEDKHVADFSFLLLFSFFLFFSLFLFFLFSFLFLFFFLFLFSFLFFSFLFLFLFFSLFSPPLPRDHSRILVGDERGRVFSWSVSEQSGRADHWVKDEVVDSCSGCAVRFSLTERRHHCRNCGQLFCQK